MSTLRVAEVSTAAGDLLFTPRRVPFKSTVVVAMVVWVATTNGILCCLTCMRAIGYVSFGKQLKCICQASSVSFLFRTKYRPCSIACLTVQADSPFSRLHVHCSLVPPYERQIL